MLGAALTLAAAATAQDRPAEEPAAEERSQPEPEATAKGVEEIVVTARKREELIQDIPIAVTALSAEDLDSSNIEDVADIQFYVPNLNFTKTNFSSAGNLSIRGVGNLAVATTSEPGTGIHVNYAPFPGSRIYETEFYDVERVEVLRGPQGTLFGRSAPGGALNIYTRKPSFQEIGGYLQGEYGNFDHRRVRGAVNIPLGDHLAARLAGYWFERDGITENLTTGNDIDDRDLYAARASLGGRWDTLDFNWMGQWFEEDDGRSRIQKQGCTLSRDPFPFNTGCIARDSNGREVRLGTDPINYFGTVGYELGALIDTAHVFTGGAVPRYLPGNLGVLSIVYGFPCYAALRGQPFIDDHAAANVPECMLPPASTFGAAAYGAPDQLYAGSRNPSNLRKVRTLLDPTYQADEFQTTLEANWHLSDAFTLTSITGWHEASVLSETDIWWAEPGTHYAAPRTWDFPDSRYGGAYNSEFVFDRSDQKDTTFAQEIRGASSSDGPFNFTAGASYLQSTIDFEYLVWAAVLEAFHDIPGDFFGLCTFDAQGRKPTHPQYSGSAFGGQVTGKSCHDYLPQTSYFKTETKPAKSYEYAAFGELYADVFENTRLTLGARYSDIHKTDNQRVNNPFTCEWSGDPESPCRILSYDDFRSPQEGDWNRVTWKVSVDRRFDLPFAPSLVYATVSTGFKGGGFNPAVFASGGTAGRVPPAFGEEEITAYELGYKGLLFDQFVFHVAGFFYDYQGMQISKIINRTAVNENVDAEITGVELESAWQVTDALRLDANVSWLDTEVRGGTSIDTADPTAGMPGWVPIKQLDFSGQNAVCNPTLQTAAVGFPACIDLENVAAGNPDTPADGYLFDGFAKNLKGRELPNAPAWSVGVGIQYVLTMGSGWHLTPRIDFYWHDKMFGRFYNDKVDEIDSWEQLGASVRLSKQGTPWQFEIWGKNLQDNDDVTGHYLADPTSANFTNLFILEPRTFGAAVRYQWGRG